MIWLLTDYMLGYLVEVRPVVSCFLSVVSLEFIVSFVDNWDPQNPRSLFVFQAANFHNGSPGLSSLKENSQILKDLELEFQALKVEKGLRVMNFLEDRHKVRPSAFCVDCPRILSIGTCLRSTFLPY